MSVHEQVTGHYGRPGMLQAILDAAEKAGRDPDALAASDLSAVDEFHLGGLAATHSLFDLLEPSPGSRLLDVGSGIGGPARVAASQYGCASDRRRPDPRVHGAGHRPDRPSRPRRPVTFRTADAVALPFPDGSFDIATLIHVGMNMPEKARAFAEVRRCVVPVHHAGVPHELSVAGFGVETEEDRTQAGIDFFVAMTAASQDGHPPIGLHVLFGPEWPVRAGNNRRALEDGTLVATVMVARAV